MWWVLRVLTVLLLLVFARGETPAERCAAYASGNLPAARTGTYATLVQPTFLLFLQSGVSSAAVSTTPYVQADGSWAFKSTHPAQLEPRCVFTHATISHLMYAPLDSSECGAELSTLIRAECGSGSDPETLLDCLYYNYCGCQEEANDGGTGCLDFDECQIGGCCSFSCDAQGLGN